MYVVNPVKYKRYVFALKSFAVVTVLAFFVIAAFNYQDTVVAIATGHQPVLPPVPSDFAGILGQSVIDRLIFWLNYQIITMVGAYFILRFLFGLVFYPLVQHGELKGAHEEMLEKVREFSDKGKLDFVRVKMSHAEISVRTVPILGGVMYHVHVVRRHRTLFTWFSYKEMTWYLSSNSLFTSHRRLRVGEIRNVILLLAQAKASIVRGRLLELDITYRS